MSPLADQDGRALDPRRVLWVVGAGGLLGRSVVAEGRSQGIVTMSAEIPWADAESAAAALRRGVAALVDSAGDSPWTICWCAGRGVVGSDAVQLEAEEELFRSLLDEVRSLAGLRAAYGSLFVASSAGGIYAGSQRPPHDESTPPRPISAYGEAKIKLEEVARSFAAETRVGLLIGRISNLYGPGQDLTKPQGLISRLCRGHILGEPISIYVPMSTVRDYLYVQDGARMILAGIVRLQQLASPARQPPRATKIIASQRGSTITAVLAEFRRVVPQGVEVTQTQSGMSPLQVSDLRFRSIVWPDLNALATTSLSEGIAETFKDVSARLASP